MTHDETHDDAKAQDPVATIDRAGSAERLRGPSPPALFEVLPRGDTGASITSPAR